MKICSVYVLASLLALVSVSTLVSAAEECEGTSATLLMMMVMEDGTFMKQSFLQTVRDSHTHYIYIL
jgi:hypothetical protein